MPAWTWRASPTRTSPVAAQLVTYYRYVKLPAKAEPTQIEVLSDGGIRMSSHVPANKHPLVHLRMPVTEAIDAVQSFPWDSEEELVTLGSAELRTALAKFISGDPSADELETWANGVEGRDDIGFTLREVIDLVTEIASPCCSPP